MLLSKIIIEVTSMMYDDEPTQDSIQAEIEIRCKERMYFYSHDLLTDEQYEEYKKRDLKIYPVGDVDERLFKLCEILTENQMKLIDAHYYRIKWPHKMLFDWYAQQKNDNENLRDEMNLHSEEDFTEKEKEFLTNLFWKNNAYSSEKLEKQINEELYILEKYKGNLAKAYNKLIEQMNTSKSFIEEIYDKQDSIVGHMKDLEAMLCRIENIFIDNQIKGRRTNPILDKPIEFLEFKIRILNCLKGAGIKTIGELINNTKRKIQIIPNLGRWSLLEIQDQLARHGLKLKE
jgi:hypothetical protein